MTTSSPKLIMQNTSFLYLRMLIVMILNIISVRFVLKGLGVVDYGIFNVVAGLVTMFSSLGSVISSAALRFHSYVLGEGNNQKISDVFTASLNIFFVLAIVILLVGEVLGIWFINTQSDIPYERNLAANWLFQLTMITFVISLITAPFTAIVLAFENMKVFSIISVAECLLKFILAISIVHLSYDHLIYYGFGLLIVSLIVLLAYVYSSRRSGCSFYYKKRVSRLLYKQMLSFSGWTLFSSSAGVGISQLVTLITNVFFGPIVNAARGIAFQVSSSLNSFTGNIITAIRPPIIKSYAEGNMQRVNSYFNFSNKAIFYSLLLVLLPLFFETEVILKLWLDIDDSQTVLFTRLILIYSLVLSLNNPIAIIVQATGDIRDYSIYSEIPTILCFPITWLLFYMSFPAETAFYVMIVAIAVSHIIRLICLKKLFPSFSYRAYIKDFIFPAGFVLILVSILLYLVCLLFSDGLLRLFICLIVCGISLLLLCLFFGFTKKEKEALFGILNLQRFRRLHI